jgi:hypothetical protein
MEEFDAPPTIDELRKAIDALSCGKASGSDAIPAGIVKAGKENSLLSHLHELLLQCWDEGTLPQDMQGVKIVTLFKNKGDRKSGKNMKTDRANKNQTLQGRRFIASFENKK